MDYNKIKNMSCSKSCDYIKCCSECKGDCEVPIDETKTMCCKRYGELHARQVNSIDYIK